jgi:EAL domain-containing protein (putative c-di-GMP-specific phosphodiesterase class I)
MTQTRPGVLFVDDDANVLASVALTLRHRPVRVLTADSAAHGFECLENEAVSVVVSDEHMPGMGGTAFLAEVRRRYPATVRMVLSGSSDPQAIAQAVNQASLFRYLLKPCTPADLVLAVDQGIEAHATRRFQRAEAHGRLDLQEILGVLGFHMQPIFSTVGELFAHEALLRLPSAYAFGAPELLAAAEREDRLWDVERAIRAAVAERIQGRPRGTSVFVNIHPRTLLDPQIYTRRDPLAPFAPAVVLEITERGSLAEIDDLPGRVAALRGVGYRVAIDDMGSGYSGLTTFTTILPDFVKFDRELTGGMQAFPAKLKLIHSIAAVCRSLGIATVAEGIETREALDAAADAGCGYLQGYFLARPARDYFEGAIAL